jgi:hypothetical protein
MNSSTVIEQDEFPAPTAPSSRLEPVHSIAAHLRKASRSTPDTRENAVVLGRLLPPVYREPRRGEQYLVRIAFFVF